MSESVPAASEVDPSRPAKLPREFSGTKLIIAVFAFAIVMSGSVWIYSYLHAKPFQPLQKAIHRTFPKSYPQVQGGQRKMHRNTTKTLRITLRVNFDPEPAESDDQVNELVDRLEKLARQNIDFPSYDVFEVHCFHRVPEHKSKTRTITREIAKSAPEKP